MDGSSFDRMARALGAGFTRRSGVFGALVALAGLGAGMPDREGLAAKHSGTGKGTRRGNAGPGIAGPCGKGRKKNSCTQNSDCCTNICKTKIKNKDKTGRCRCEKKGRPCSEDRNCCGSIKCVAGKCGGKAPMVNTGDACGPNDVCRDPNAACTTYEFDIPAGTYCLLPVKALCASGSDCTSSQCALGLCRPCSTAACAEACTPIVCTTCTYKTVQAAIDAATDGDVIAIGKGTWVEDLAISSKDLTLRACPGERVTLRNASYGSNTITVTGGKSLAVLDIIVDGYSDYDNSNDGGGIVSDGNLTLAGTTVVKNAGWKGNSGGSGVAVAGDGLLVTVTDDVVIRDNIANWNGGGLWVKGASDLVVSGWAEIADNTSDSYGGGIATEGVGVNVTISGHARITGNVSTNDYHGAGISITGYNYARATTVTIKDDAVIADNVATGSSTGYGGGLGVFGTSTAPVTVLITDRVQITGNYAGGDGGGMSLNQWVTATISGEVEISGNTADSYGGGVLVAWDESGRPAGSTPLTITGSAQVINNTAGQRAGGIYVNESALLLEGSAVISANTAPNGGGVAMEGASYGAELTVGDSATITGNTATATSPSGGGVWAASSRTAVSAVAGSITGNTPDQCAGGSISC